MNNVAQWGAYLRDNWVTQIVPTVYQAGGEILDAGARNSTFDRAETADGFQWRNDLMYVHKVAADPDETESIAAGIPQGPLINGRAAMYEHLLGQESQWPDPDSIGFEIGSMVGLKGKKPSNSFFNHQMHIAKSSAAPEESWMYMLFQVTDEQSALEIYTKADYGLPANTKLWTSLPPRARYPTSIDPWLHEWEQGWTNDLGTNVAWVEWYVAWRAEWQESSFNRRPVSESLCRDAGGEPEGSRPCVQGPSAGIDCLAADPIGLRFDQDGARGLVPAPLSVVCVESRTSARAANRTQQ